MTIHTVDSVLRASTAKVQTKYHGKYPCRMRYVSADTKSKSVYLVSNDHRVLTMSYQEAAIISQAAFDAMNYMKHDIELLAAQIARHRNALLAGHAMGKVALRVTQSINRTCGPLASSDSQLIEAEQMYSSVVFVALSTMGARNLSMNSPYSDAGLAYNKARTDAREAAKADARVKVQS